MISIRGFVWNQALSQVSAWEEFARLLFSTTTLLNPTRTIRLEFQGTSWWLKNCQSAVENLPYVRMGGSPDVVVTDSSNTTGWYFALNGCRLSSDLREFFWHANKTPQSIDLSLHSDQGTEGCLRIPPVPGFYWLKEHAAAIEAAPALLIVAILRRLCGSHCAVDSQIEVRPSASRPGALVQSWFQFRKLSRSLYLRLTRTNGAKQWRIALHANVQASIPKTGWEWTTGIMGHEAADPFLVSDRGKLWLFYEDILPKSGHGRLAVMRAFEDADQPSIIINKSYHLSYPCVFEHAGEWWMIPESSANATVDLYRARRFPHEWQHWKTLVRGPRLVDTTPCYHEGQWYFFTTAILPGRAYVSLLFVAEALDASWQLHPVSPVSGSAANARSAGPILRWQGRLIRPVQNCLPTYGHSMMLNEIVQLSPSLLKEQPMKEILPCWHPGLFGTHTFSPSGQALALDALR